MVVSLNERWKDSHTVKFLSGSLGTGRYITLYLFINPTTDRMGHTSFSGKV